MKKSNLSKTLLKVLFAVMLTACIGISMIACNDKNFTVAFNSDGGSPVASITVKSGNTIEKPDDPTKSGYTFDKWVKSDGTDFVFEKETVKNDMTLTAKWNINVYTVKFVTDGGSDIEDQKINHNNKAARPADPTKKDEIFVDWYEDQSFTTLFDFSKSITGDTRIYGRFTKETENIFTIKFIGSETMIPDQKTNKGGLLTSLPTPVKSGATFIGWWMSDYEDVDRLTCQYTDQIIYESRNFYAVWESTAPAVSVDSNGVSWTSKGVSASYSLVITLPDQTNVTRTQSTTKFDYDFTTKIAGEYKVEVTFNNNKATVYYRNKALSRITVFEEEGTTLKFNAVANADHYLIDVDCGSSNVTHQQSHAPYSSTKPMYDFVLCTMKTGGITFTVQAVASGYLTSLPVSYNIERTLDVVTNIAIDDVTQEFTWDKVNNAENYVVKINNETAQTVTTEKSASVKMYEPGEIKITVYATARGYNPSAPVEYTYTKIRLATPNISEITINGDILSWTTVTGAKGYIVSIDGDEQEVSTNELQIEIDKTTIHISIRALGETRAEDSVFSDVVIASATLEPENNVYYENGYVCWVNIFGATSYAVRFNGEVTPVTDGSRRLAIAFDKKGKHEIEVCFYDKNNNESPWRKIEVTAYTVTLYYNIDENYDVYKVLYRALGDDLNLPATVDTVPGYTFDYWSDAKVGIKYIESSLVTADDKLSLYAHWIAKKFTATYSYEGGTMEEGKVSGEATYRQNYKLDIPTTNDPARAFAGWYSEPSGKGIQYTDYKGYSLDIWKEAYGLTVYAYWAEAFTFQEVNDDEYGKAYAVLKGQDIADLTEITIPATYKGLPVTIVESNAFQACRTLITINIPDTIKLIYIGTEGGNDYGSSFYFCDNLLYVNIYKTDPTGNVEAYYASHDGVLFAFNKKTGNTELKYYPYGRPAANYVIPNSLGKDVDDNDIVVDIIGISVFRSAKITSITIPSSVIRIDAKAFNYCQSLTTITFLETPNGQADKRLVIAEDAFTSCTKLTQITLPTRLAEFAVKTFVNCSALEKILFVGTGGNYTSIQGLVCSADGKTLVYCPRGVSGEFKVPAGIEVIGEDAFSNYSGSTYTGYYGTGITKLTIPSYVVQIDKSAFRGCSSILELVFDSDDTDNPLSIMELAFYGCTGLIEVTLPENLKLMKPNAFGATSKLKTVTVNGTGVLDYKDEAFGSLAGEYATPSYYVTDLYLGPKTTLFSVGGVFGHSVARVVVDPLNPNFTSYENVLYDKDITEIIFYPAARIGAYDMPESVKTIGPNIFKNKTNLETIIIGKNVTSIGANAFDHCTKLTSVQFKPGGAGLKIGERAFYYCSLLKNIDLPNHLTSIGNEAFANTALESIVIPSSVITIGNAVFYWCRSLESIEFSEGLEEIGEQVFFYCQKLESVTFPASLKKLAISETEGLYKTFEYCDSLKTITVADGGSYYTSIAGVLYGLKGGAITDLYYCPSMVSGDEGVIDIPKTVTKIWAKAFYLNLGLKEITFSEGVTGTLTIGVDAFNGCKALEKVSLPRGLQTVSTNLFKDCIALGEVVIPNTVTLMQVNIFTGCFALTTVTFETGGTETLVFADGGGNGGVFTGCLGIEEIAFPDRTKKIGDHMFYEYTGGTGVYALRSVTIPSSVTEIGQFAFCTSRNANVGKDRLKEVIFDDFENSQLTTIGVYAFYNCRYLTTFDVPASVTMIGYSAFAMASVGGGLEEINFTEDSQLEYLGSSRTLLNSGFTFEYSALKSIEIPKGIKKFSRREFYNCRQLTEVTFAHGSQLDAIGDLAFQFCSKLESFDIPATVITIGADAFRDCISLNSIGFDTLTTGENAGKTSLTTIGASAFANTALTSFTFPENITGKITLGATLFQGSKKLTTVTLSKSIQDISGVFNKSYIKTIKVVEGSLFFKVDKDYPILYNADGKAIQLTFGELFGDEGVYTILEGTTQIGAFAFQNQIHLTKIVIPYTVQTIGTSAFYNCINLKEVVIGTDAGNGGVSNLGSLGENAFENCVSLQKIDLSKTKIVALSKANFLNCHKLESVLLPETLERIGFVADTANVVSGNGEVFKNCYKLQSITVPNKVKTINGMYNFANTYELDTVTLSTSLTLIGRYTFQNSGIKTITFKSNIGIFGTYVFQDCKRLSTVNFDDTMTRIGDTNTFDGCTALKTITLPRDLRNIGQYTFQNSGLTSIKIPNDVQHFATSSESPATATTASGLFNGCVDLESVELPAGLLTMGTIVFQNCVKLKTVTYTGQPKEADDSLKNSLPPNMAVIGNNAFTGCTQLKSIYIPKTTSAFGTSIFTGCTALENVTFAMTITALSNNMFDGCTALKTVELPTSLYTMGNYAFQNSGLTSILLPASLTKMGTSVSALSYAFAGCKELESVTFPATFEGTGTFVFQNCTKLVTITYDGYTGKGNSLPPNMTVIGNGTFMGCTALKQLALPGAQTLGFSVFNGCTSLQGVDLPAAVTVGYNVFLNCKALLTIELPKVTSLGYSAFEGCLVLYEITLNDSLATIGTNTFANCKALKSITLPSNLSSLGNYAFFGSGIESITIPAKVTNIGSYTFSVCYDLEQIIVENANVEFLINDDGILLNNKGLIIWLPLDLKGSITLTGVTEINDYTFYANALITEIIIPASVTYVGDYAFAYSVLESITFLGAPELGSYMFYACKSLTSVILHDDMVMLSNYMFAYCTSLTEITLPENLDFMGQRTFQFSGIESIVIPEKVIHIANSRGTAGTTSSNDSYLFENCENLVSVVLPSNLLTLGGRTFQNCTSLSSITYTGYEGTGNVLPENTSILGMYVFVGCKSLEQLTFTGVTSIGSYVFSLSSSSVTDYNTVLKTVALPKITNIGSYMFMNCTALTSVTLNDELVSLGAYMFYGTTSLKSITLPSALRYMNTYSFKGSGIESIVIPESVVHMGTSLDSAVTVATGVYIFDGCEGLTNVVLSSKLTTMGGMAFQNCKALESVTYTGYTGTGNALPETLTLMAYYAFAGTGIESITLPVNLARIGDYAFSVSKLKTVRFLGNVFGDVSSATTTYGKSMFENCVSLQAVVFENDIATIPAYAFKGCIAMETFVVKSGVVVQHGAFSGWTNTQTVRIEDSHYTVMSNWGVPTTSTSEYWADGCNAILVWEYIEPNKD